MPGRTNRWRGWARSLRSRHARIALRRDPAAMVLVRLRPSWMHGPSFHVSPQVWVTIRAENGRSTPGQRVVQAVRREWLMREHRFESVRWGAPVQGREKAAAFASTPPLPGPAGVSMPSAATVAQMRQAMRGEGAWRPARWIRDSIARDVLGRMRRAQEIARAWRPAATQSPAPAEIARRIVQQSARREERMAAPPPMTLPASSAPAHADRQAVDFEDGRARREWEPKPVVQPLHEQINLDALTSQVMDQIDRRVIAWRERMGRI